MFGPHVHKGKSRSYENALQRDMDEMKMYGVQAKSCQIFVMGPKNTKENFDADEAKAFGEFCKEKDVKIIVHNSYLVSLWNTDVSKRPFARMNIRKQLALCDTMHASGFVIHIPNEPVTSIMHELIQLNLAEFKTPIYLETKASNPTGKGTMNYELPENLDLLFTAIANSPISNHVGHCVDTAHLWSSGVSMTTREEVVQYFNKLSRIAGGHLWKKIINDNNGLMFHLNDAINDFANGKDEHALLGKGQIWGANRAGLKELINYIKESNLIAILERNNDESMKNDCDMITGKI